MGGVQWKGEGWLNFLSKEIEKTQTPSQRGLQVLRDGMARAGIQLPGCVFPHCQGCKEAWKCL